MATGGHKSNKPELIAIYRLEFYKNKKKWKFSNEKNKDSKQPPVGRPEEKSTKNINKTYDLEPNHEYEKEVSPLNNAFMHEIPNDTPEDFPYAPPPSPHPTEDHQHQEIYAGDTYYNANFWFNSGMYTGPRTEVEQPSTTQIINDYQPDILHQPVPNNQNQQANMHYLLEPNKDKSLKVNNHVSDPHKHQSEQLWSVQTSDEDSVSLNPQNICINPVIPANLPDREMLANLLKKRGENDRQQKNGEIPPPVNCLQSLLCHDKWKNEETPVPSEEIHRKTCFWKNPALVAETMEPYTTKNELNANSDPWIKQMQKGNNSSLTSNFQKSSNQLNVNPECLINQVPDIPLLSSKFQTSNDLINVNSESWYNQLPTSPTISSFSVQKSNNLLNDNPESWIHQTPTTPTPFTKNFHQDNYLHETLTSLKLASPQDNYQLKNQMQSRPYNQVKPRQLPPNSLMTNKGTQPNPGNTWVDYQRVPRMDPGPSLNPAALQYTYRNQNWQKPEFFHMNNIQGWSPISVDNPDGLQSSEDPHQVDLQMSAVEQSTLKPQGSTEGFLTPEQIRRSTDEWLRRLLALYRPKDECTDSDIETNQGNDSTEFVREAHEVPHSSEKDFNETRECVCSYIPKCSLHSLSSGRLSAAIQHGAEVLRNVLKEQLIRDNLRSLTVLNVVEYPTRDTDLFGTEYVQGGSHLPHSHKYLPQPHGEESGIKIDMGRPYRL